MDGVRILFKLVILTLSTAGLAQCKSKQPYEEPLLQAIEKNDITLIEELAQSKKTLKSKVPYRTWGFFCHNCPGYAETGGTAIHYAALLGRIKATKILLKAGADPNSVAEKDVTPLIIAIWKKHYEVAEVLMQHKAKVNFSSKNSTALSIALKANDRKAMKLLIEYGAVVNIPPKEFGGYETPIIPLAFAVYKRDLELVDFLLENGAKIDLKMKQGFAVRHSKNKHLAFCTAIDYAYTDADFTTELQNRGAKLYGDLMERSRLVIHQNPKPPPLCRIGQDPYEHYLH